MTTIFQDSFTAADGTLDGRTPDVAYGGIHWSTNSASLTGGMLISSNRITADGYYAPVTPANTATAIYAFSSPPAPTAIDIEFTFITGPDVAGDGSRVGTSFTVHFNGVYFSAYVEGTYSGSTMTWGLVCGYGSIPVAVTLADNTSYSGVYSIADGAQSITLNSVTASDTRNYSTSDGLEQVNVTVGGAHFLGDINVLNLSVSSDGAVTLPSAVIAGTGSKKTGAAAVSIRPTMSAWGGGNGSMALGSLAVKAQGHNSTGERSLAVTLGMPTFGARGGVNAAVALPLGNLGISGTFWGLGRADLSMPEGFVSATGRVASGGNAAVSMPLSTLVGYAGAICSITLDDGFTVAATGTAGAVGQATITLPLFDITATGSRPNTGSAALVMPAARLGATAQAWLIAPSMQLTAVGTAVVAVTYEAYAVNLKTIGDAPGNEVTHYTNYPFDRIVRYKNSYFGMNSTGLYLLEGTTDNGAPISYEMRTHVTDFNETAKKTAVSVYFGGRLGAAETVTLYAADNTPNAYTYTTPRGTSPQNYRQKFGKGIKERYYALGVAGANAFELSSIEFEINTLARRI